jgi:proteasome lid subunit RPN8/RPN11
LDLDIQFGDVQEQAPERHLRPDRNAHYAVASYENPAAGELPIFLDLDVLRDMEVHAASDTSVELGGVLLGGQFHDEDGQPFVLITDSLRAQHYESTKGSFKFTKDTWTEINRQRNDFAPELQMVGWYHTHPDWGVFLSGMDMFICDNFFNKLLDVAYVIDPCRGDRAFFQWTNNPRERCKRTRGFYVIASRYRQAELEATVALLQGSEDMPQDPRHLGYSGGAPVVNITQPQSQAPYQHLIVLGMLTIQFCLLAILAWKVLLPTAPAEAESTELAKVAKQLEVIATMTETQRQREAQAVVLDKVMKELRGTPQGLVQELTQREQENAALEASLLGQHALTEKHQNELVALKAETSAKTEHLERQVKRWKEDFEHLKASDEKKLDNLRAELKKYKPETEEGDEEATAVNWTWYWIGGALVALTALGFAAATLSYRQTPAESEDMPSMRPFTPANPPSAPSDTAESVAKAETVDAPQQDPDHSSDQR